MYMDPELKELVVPTICRAMKGLARRGAPALVLATVAACSTTAPKKAPVLPMEAGDEQHTITPEHLVSMTEGLADSYVGTITGAVNELQASEPTPKVRTWAQQLKVFVATTAYAVATRPNPQVGLIEMTANIDVQRLIWTGGLAEERFGERSGPIIKAYDEIDAQAWATLGRVFSPRQLDLLRDGIQRWIAAHPHYHWLPFVDLPALARYRDVSLLSTPGTLRVLAPVAEASRAAMELRLLGERSLFLAQRLPFMLESTTELSLYRSLATPEARTMLDSTQVFASTAEEMAGVVEQLPNAELVRGTVAELNETLRESGPLLATMRGVVSDLNETLGSADRLLAPFQTPAVGGGPPERTFDANQYTTVFRELGNSVRELNELLLNTKALVTSSEVSDRLNQMQDVSSKGVARIATQGDRWIDRVFWRGVVLVIVFFAALFGYRVATMWLSRRFGAGRER
jgi:hypothetical protein